MAWTAPRTWTTENPAASLFNTHLRDNLLSLRNGNDHYVKLFLDNNQSIPNNTDTAITWTDEAFQVGTIWSAANPTRLTAPVTGKYLVMVNVEWRSNSANLRSVNITRSAGGAGQYDLKSQGASGSKSNISAQLVVSLTAAQFLTIRVFQSSGGALTVHGGTQDRTRVAMIFLGT